MYIYVYLYKYIYINSTFHVRSYHTILVHPKRCLGIWFPGCLQGAGRTKQDLVIGTEPRKTQRG